jgi:transposase
LPSTYWAMTTQAPPTSGGWSQMVAAPASELAPATQLASKGAGGARCRLTPAQLEELPLLLDAGPAAWGWEDQCWTLPRIAAVVQQRFGVDYTLPGVDLLLHRLGWSVQIPARRAAERNEEWISAWREESWPEIKGRWRTWAPGWSSKTSPARG